MTLMLSIDVPEFAQKSIRTIAEAQNDNFLELVATAKLDKRADFVGMSFAEMNLDGLELKGFNFTDVDFRECSLKGTVFVECELRGAAFNFPPEVRNKWGMPPDIFLGNQQDDTLELMRIASEASRKEERKEAAEKLLALKGNDEIDSFLRNLSLDDKAKTVRSWLRGRLTDSLKETHTLRSILERSLFKGGKDLDDDISLYVKILEGSDIATETLCHACANNPHAIKRASKELANSATFKRFLINCIAHSDSHRGWMDAAAAVGDLQILQAEKDGAFAARLLRTTSKYELSYLAELAALNNVSLSKLFELSESGYQNEPDRWRADDFLLYCYFYDRDKYSNDVIFYAFADAEGEIPRHGAFAAYCLVHRPRLFRAIKNEHSYFFIDPLAALGLKQSVEYDRLSANAMHQIRELAQQAYRKAHGLKSSDLIRPPSAAKPLP
jgi:hypothetical protein